MSVSKKVLMTFEVATLKKKTGANYLSPSLSLHLTCFTPPHPPPTIITTTCHFSRLPLQLHRSHSNQQIKPSNKPTKERRKKKH